MVPNATRRAGCQRASTPAAARPQAWLDLELRAVGISGTAEGQLQQVRELLHAGADPTAGTPAEMQNDTLLGIALARGTVTVARELVGAGGRPRDQSVEGQALLTLLRGLSAAERERSSPLARDGLHSAIVQLAIACRGQPR